MITIISNVIFHYAMLLVPIAIVETVTEGIQPLFVILYGVLLTIFFPKIINENIERKSLLQEILAIGIVYLGLQDLV